jgi:PDDEXK-like domain of unknown function (DUF3799)
VNEVAALERPIVPDFVPGVFYGMPAELYHSIPALSAGGARRLRKSPAHFKEFLGVVSEPSAAMQLGTVIHCGVLEPDRLDDCYAVAPEVDKRTSAGKAEWATFQAACAGKVVLTPEGESNALGAIDAVRAHPAARRLLDGAKTELSLFWEDAKYQVPCKCRWDALSTKGVGIDLKSTQDASREAFARSIATFEYHAAAAHYISGAEHALDASPRGFVLIAVETVPPWAVACYQLGSASILAGEYLTRIALERYAEGLKTGVWKGYPDTIDAIEVPRWALRFDV